MHINKKIKHDSGDSLLLIPIMSTVLHLSLNLKSLELITAFMHLFVSYTHYS